MRAITPSHTRIFARKYALMHLREFKCAALYQSALEPVRIFEFNNTLSHSSEFKSLQAIKHYCIQVNSNLCAQPNAPEIEQIRRFARNHTCLLSRQLEVRANSNLRARSLVQRLHPRIFADNRTFPFLSEFEFLRAITSSSFYTQYTFPHINKFESLRTIVFSLSLLLNSNKFNFLRDPTGMLFMRIRTNSNLYTRSRTLHLSEVKSWRAI